MKGYIWFREGLSGHFLKAVLSGSKEPGKFRMDPWYPGIYDSRQDTSDDWLKCGHRLPTYQSFDFVLQILVRQKIYHAIYNVFHKKLLIEQIVPEQYKNWRSNMPFWYDKAFYNIQDYFQKFTQEANASTHSDIVEFDQLLDAEYLNQLSLRYLGKPLQDRSYVVVQEYAQQQLNVELPYHGTDMAEILDTLPDDKINNSPWFAAYAIYKFEYNNNLAESQRRWSIDAITKPIDKQFLLEISQQYN